MKTTQEQYAILKEHFNGKFVDTGLQGFLIPKVKGSYAVNVQKALDAIESTRPFYNYRRKGSIDDKHLRRTERTAKALDALYEAQKGDYIVIGAQLGTKFKGASVTNARERFEDREFGLGAFEVACILLADPDTLKSYDDLWIDCAGDEFDVPDSDVRFGRAPFFNFDGGGVRFGAGAVGDALGDYGAASGLFPQSTLENRPLESFDDSSIEAAIKAVKEAGYKVIKEM